MGIVLVRSLPSDAPPERPAEPGPAPAAPGALAYILDGDVYVADPDGSNAVVIADGIHQRDCASTDGFFYWAEGSMWSPDGRYLAYRRVDCSNGRPWTRENWGDVVISDVAGNVLAAFPADGWDIGWSPDSTRVAVWDTTFETIGVYGLDGVRQTQLTMPAEWEPSGDRDPMWMPSGTSVLLENWELPLDGGTPRQTPWGESSPTFSPDGSRVAYVEPIWSTAGPSLVVARSDGSEPLEVFRDWSGGDLTWSPGGDQIAVDGQGPLRMLDVATGSLTLLIEQGAGDLWVVGFSPQDERVLFVETEDGGAAEASLWSVRIDGSDARRVLSGSWQLLDVFTKPANA
jgi:Tol biopolymer transport system component